MRHLVILIAARALHSTTSGIPRIVHNSVRELSAYGFRVYVFGERIDKPAFQKYGAIPLAGIRLPFVRGYLRRTWFALQARWHAYRLKVDIVIGHGDLIRQDIAYVHNCVHLAHERLYNTPLPTSSDVGRIHHQNLTQQKFSKLVCNSYMMQDDLCSRFSIDTAKTCVIYPTVDTHRFSPQVRDQLRAQARQDLRIANNELLLGMIISGAFHKRNVSLFINIVEYLRKEKKLGKVKALIAGNNNDKSYSRAIARKQLDRHIQIVPATRDVARYYAALDLFLLPAHIEEFGLSVVEAMACANPVIISDAVGAGELIDNATIVRTMSVESYANVIMPLLTDAKLRQARGRANAQLAYSYTSETSLTEIILNIKSKAMQ